MNRRQFLGGLAASTACLALPMAFANTLQLSRRRLTLWGDGGPPLRIAHLSDLHSSRAISLEHIARAVEWATREQPHLICLTGDFVTDYAPDPAGLSQTLSRLSAAAPCIACLGNHDGGRWSAQRGRAATPDAALEILRAANIRVLRNETEFLTLSDRSLLLTGIEDLWSFPVDPARAGMKEASRTRIVLAHNPDTKDELARVPWALMLSGHTHGGQIRVPFYGGRLTAPVRDHRYIEGLLPWGTRWLHISRGVGSLYGLRINCPPEVTLLELA